jgi:hypothetical protein
VREQPSAADYVQFLSDLAQECHGAALNPNELRAVVAIVQAVAARYEEDVEAEGKAVTASARGSANANASASGRSNGDRSRSGRAAEGSAAVSDGLLGKKVFVPDDESRLRDADYCLANVRLTQITSYVLLPYYSSSIRVFLVLSLYSKEIS